MLCMVKSPAHYGEIGNPHNSLSTSNGSHHAAHGLHSSSKAPGEIINTSFRQPSTPTL